MGSMIKINRLCCLLLLLASTTLLQAQRLEITPFYGYRFGGEIEDAFTGENYSFEDAPAYGMFLRLGPTNSEMKVEFLWSRQDSSVDFKDSIGHVDLTIDEFQIGGVAEIGNERFREYVSAHVGATYFSTDDYGSETKFSFGLGIGGKLILSKHFLLQADLRGFCTIVDAEGGFIYYNGVTVATYSGSTIWQGQATLGVGITF
jgi:hypothetical protein